MQGARCGPRSRSQKQTLTTEPPRKINELEKAIEQINEIRSWFYEKIDKIKMKINSNNFKKSLTCERQEIQLGQKLDPWSADPDFTVWIKKCQEAQNGSQSEVSDSQRTHQSKIKYDWYQTESQVIITLMIENVQKNNVNVEFSEKELSALVKLPSGEDYNLKLRLLHPIIPEQSTFKVLSTKIEIKMKKTEAVRWEKLEGQGDNLYPSSSHYTRNWDKLAGEVKEEEKNEKLTQAEGEEAGSMHREPDVGPDPGSPGSRPGPKAGAKPLRHPGIPGDAALNKLFQQIYSGGSDESGGTVLSTNWSDVGKRKVEINPPDDMDWKKY
ncbi:unnamed protein product [Nyctereutes procyonoides]|uniref:(raccoon dog) hypothetical protein n=1 Tax=Nyctereutes procyonoides TaxID=34880 RepID=A0A811ZQZ9_NYCPR|nr:unnamed protein product [Nyctereutes procyonoides]